MSLTYSLLVPTNPAYARPSQVPKGGILLNAIRPQYHHHQHHPRHHLVSPPSPGSSTDSSDAPTTKADSQPRRITFAPLPRPRTFVNQDGETVPVIVFNDSLDIEPKLIYDDPEASSSLSGDDGNSLPVSISNASLNRTSSIDSFSKKPVSSSWSSTKKLFRPFYKLKKVQTEEGTGISLFRASSRDSTTSATSFSQFTDGSPLTRRMSTGSAQPSTSPSFGYPLTTVASENGGSAATRQTRMLNGRVYGGQRNRQITSLPQQETADPEFVEWGYGGMGSRSAVAGNSAYAGVQSSQKNAVAGAEEDDGSGMGWVQRRRAARERERKERESKEAEEKQDAVAEVEPTTANIHKEDDSASVATAKLFDGGAGTPPTPRPHTPSSHPPHAMTDEEHITRAIKVPATHKPRASRQSSIDLRPSSSGSATPTVTAASGRGTPMRKSSDSSHTTIAAASINIPHGSSLRPRTDEDLRVSEEEEEESSSSDDIEDSGADRETEEDEEDDEEEIRECERKTSLCAGVEKISRHKD